MPSRASFMTERYVRDHGVYTNWAEIAPDSPTYAWALREAGYHTPRSVRRTCTATRTVAARTWTSIAPSAQGLGFAEVYRDGRQVRRARSRTAIPTYLRRRGLLDTYRKHIADRSYQGENEDGQNATKWVPMWDATPMPLPLARTTSTPGTAAGGRAGSSTTTDRSRSSSSSGFPGPHDPWDAPREAVERYRDVDISMPGSTQRPDDRGHRPLRRCS